MDRLSDSTANRRLSPEVLERALHATDIMIVLTDPHEDDNPIVWVNDYFCEFTGYARDEVLGRNCRFLQDRPDGGRDEGQDAVRELRQAVEAGENVNVLVRNYKKDGTAFENDLYVSPVREGGSEGRVLYFIGVQNDATAQVRAEREAAARVREVEEAAEDERERFGMDLRDGLGQELAGLARLLQGLVNRLRTQSPAHAPVADRLLHLLHGALGSARQMAQGLNPVAPSPQGLGDALRALAASVSEGAPGLAVRAEAEAVAFEDRRAARHLYRIAQEALENVAEHAGATEAVVTLRQSAGAVALEVRDDGVGIDPNAVWADGAGEGARTERAQQGVGLYGMRYRAKLAGGTLTVNRAEGGGTVVRCVLPHRDGGGGEHVALRAGGDRAGSRNGAGTDRPG